LTKALRTTTTRKDDIGRDVQVTGTRRDGITVPETSTVFDGIGRVTSQTNTDITTNVVFTPDGRPETTITTPAKPDTYPGPAITATRQFDPMGASIQKTLTTQTTSAQSHPGTTRILDVTGRTISETDQAGNTTTIDYTVDGLVEKTHNQGSGVTTTNTYDPVTRLLIHTQTTGTDGSTSQTGFEYHPVTGALTSVFDPANKQATQISYTYDLYGNTTDTRYPDGKTITHVFDQWGTQTSTTDTTGNITEYVYDRYGLLETVTQINPDGTLLGRVMYEYDQFGRTTKLSRNNGVITVYTFTSADQIKTETTTSNGGIILDAAYEYDTHGNLTKRVETRPETTNTLVTETTTHTYNTYNQLVSTTTYPGATLAGTPTKTTNYEIGIAGNITKETTTNTTNDATISATSQNTTGGINDSSTTVVREFETNSLGQTTAITTNGVRAEQTYDAAGNLTTAADGTTTTYNTHNQLLTQTQPNGTTTHTYWSNGQKATSNTNTTPNNQQTTASQQTTSETTEYYWDGTTLTNETHTTGSTTGEPTTPQETTVSYLSAGTTRHTRTLNSKPDTTNYYTSDRHANTRNQTNTQGEITNTYTYTDYGVATHHTTNGATTGANRNPFQYAGEYTTETGNQYLGTRTYQPTLMAFTTRDSAPLFNLYSYTNANPITQVDPTGQAPQWDAIINGLILGATLLATIISAGLLASAAITAGAASLWNAWGIAATIATVGDLTSTGIATVQIINQHTTSFITDQTNQILTKAGTTLGIVSIFGSIGAAGKTFKNARNIFQESISSLEVKSMEKLKTTETYFGNTISGYRRMTGEKGSHLVNHFSQLDNVPPGVLNDISKFMSENGGGIMITNNKFSSYTTGQRNIRIGSNQKNLGPLSSQNPLLHEMGHAFSDTNNHYIQGFPKEMQQKFAEFRPYLREHGRKLNAENSGFTHQIRGTVAHLQNDQELYAELFAWRYSTPEGPTSIYGREDIADYVRTIFPDY
jgi:RHS repeat-associated protein